MAASFTLSMGEETDLSCQIHDLLLSKIPPRIGEESSNWTNFLK
jgi:hypothetical protein